MGQIENERAVSGYDRGGCGLSGFLLRAFGRVKAAFGGVKKRLSFGGKAVFRALKGRKRAVKTEPWQGGLSLIY